MVKIKRNLSSPCDLEEKREKRREKSGGRDTRTRLIDEKIISIMRIFKPILD